MKTYENYWKSILLLLLLNSNYSFGQTVETFSTPGSFTWTCPANVSQITVECWGGGGGEVGDREGGGGGHSIDGKRDERGCEIEGEAVEVPGGEDEQALLS